MTDRLDDKILPVERDDVAPDGSDVRVLCQLDKGGWLTFELAPGAVARAIVHRTVEEIIGVTMPPWPGQDEATVAEGRWAPTV